MLKLQRNYIANFEIRNEEQIRDNKQGDMLSIQYPFSCEIQIDLGSYNSANRAVIQFYNLSKQDQAALWLDVYNIGKKQIFITLKAGYGETMPMVFFGWVQSCTSYRPSGSTEWVTEIQAYEGGQLFQYGFINATFSKYTKLEDVVKLMLEGDPETKIGYITPDIPPLPKNKTFIGQTMDLLGREYGGYEVIIDKGKLSILGENDVIPGDLLVITDQSGLLGSPRRANLFLEVDLLFEPQIKVGQAVSLLCDSMPQFNQAYKVIAIKHYGTISPVDNGKLVTSLTLSAIPANYRTLEPVQDTAYQEEKVSSLWEKPLKGAFRITDFFGWRIHPISKEKKFHEGVDYGAVVNSPVYAPANGKVVFTGWFDGYGRCITVDNGAINGKTVTSRYGHLNSINVQYGQQIYKGQVIGAVGTTGYSTGPHLHFEVRENGQPVNPLKYIN